MPNVVDRRFLDHSEIPDVDKVVEGLVSENSDDVVQTVGHNFEVGEVARNSSTCDFVVDDLEHSKGRSVLGVESLKDEGGVEAGIRLNFQVSCFSKDTVGVKKFEVAQVVEPEFVLILRLELLIFR